MRVSATGGKKPLSQHSVSPTYDEVFEGISLRESEDFVALYTAGMVQVVSLNSASVEANRVSLLRQNMFQYK